MKAAAKQMICNESEGLRGQFQWQPGIRDGLTLAGSIETAHGERVFVKDGDAVRGMRQSAAPYFLVTFDTVAPGVVSVRDFMPLQSLDSTGEMVCGC